MELTWSTPPKKVREEYIKAVQSFLNDDEKFKTFRAEPKFQTILEGNEDIVERIAFITLKKHGGMDFLIENIAKFKENDSIGSPRITESFGLSPATIRYVNSLWEIKLLLDGYEPKRILEIGGGYGGLCKIISTEYDFDKYTLIDLPDVEKLTDKYLSNFSELDGKIDHEVSGEYELFIADSSLAECDFETQLEYGRWASRCKYVYIVYNTFHIKEFADRFNEFLKLFGGYSVLLEPAMDEQGRNQKGIRIFSMKKTW